MIALIIIAVLDVACAWIAYKRAIPDPDEKD